LFFWGCFVFREMCGQDAGPAGSAKLQQHSLMM